MRRPCLRYVQPIATKTSMLYNLRSGAARVCKLGPHACFLSLEVTRGTVQHQTVGLIGKAGEDGIRCGIYLHYFVLRLVEFFTRFSFKFTGFRKVIYIITYSCLISFLLDFLLNSRDLARISVFFCVDLTSLLCPRLTSSTQTYSWKTGEVREC